MTNKEIKPATPKKRLLSVDALRGFDMFWIMGAEKLFIALFFITGWSMFSTLDGQMKHASWHGFTAYDLIFPLFIFLSGVSIGLAAKSINTYDPPKRKALYKHAYTRLGLLLLLGIVYNHGWGTGIPAAPEQIRYASVLGRIGIAWFVAIMLVWHCSVRTQWLTSISLLVGYWLVLRFITIGQYGGGDYSAEFALNVWFDQTLLPGITYRDAPMDPEGILSNIPSIVNAMAGVFIGRLIKQLQLFPTKLIGLLVVAGSLCLAVGVAWGQIFPINKSLWTSSFALVTIGLSVLILALFYWLIDVLEWKRLATWFAVIGMNSIVIYISTSIFDWQFLSKSLFGGIATLFGEGGAMLLIVSGTLLLQWLFLYWLYKRNIFIKV
ncbi:transmembrane glucosamine N-acetyltransferase NagX [Thalassotalea euphylliae]|uniref:transmembrane glucosamine N-acetyltransferase NagX n=1 Tax=Thalassotalea euphylliae TaxID=1655234 RepID=UPI0036314F18